MYPDSQWNTFDGGIYKDDPADGGSLNYHDHLIMVVADKRNGIGYGRVMPVRTSRAGGVNIVKNLWKRGFETFSATGESVRKPFAGFLFIFDQGIGAALEMGKRIVDGDRFIDFSGQDISQAAVLESVDQSTGGWYHSGWFGWFYASYWPMIWHQSHGWLYMATNPSNNLFIYDYSLGWLWTRFDTYPYLYQYSQNNWLNFNDDT